ncbi:hypothetical protein CXB51_033522 [Gossypium anomalum]|uniref:DUF4283 domain-containing protein n=1 Tax=Gossypium anomalum TaxID=47600 RepID=A0A8J5Y7C0_9ROSI|nr:hypothetical protein CXB51_033522 [Gossypium anomalum]
MSSTASRTSKKTDTCPSFKDMMNGNEDAQEDEDFELSEGDVVNRWLMGFLGSDLFVVKIVSINPTYEHCESLFLLGFQIIFYPSNMVVWIRLPGLVEEMYIRDMLCPIGTIVGKVIEVDYKIDNGSRGRFAHIVISIGKLYIYIYIYIYIYFRT